MKADNSSGGVMVDRWRVSVVVAVGVATVWWLCFHFSKLWTLTGIGEAERPFLDLYALLAAYDARQIGLNPLLPNPLDPYNRPFGFSDWWFGLAPLGLGRKDTIWLGVGVIGVALATVVAMVQPRNRREGIALGLLLVSPAWLLSVNRANQDLVVLVVVSLALVCFRHERTVAKALGVILFAVAAVLKYFPLVTLLLLLDLRPRRQALAGLALFFIVLLLAWPGLAPALKLAGRHAPAPDWLYAFGAPVLLRDFGISGVFGWLVPAGLLVLWAMLQAWKRLGPTLSRRTDADERMFICGAAMLVGVFFLGVSYAYKLVFAVWLLPWLWRHHPGGAEAWWIRLTTGLLFASAWLEGVVAVGLNLLADTWSRSKALIVLQTTLGVTQLLTWMFIACLLRFMWLFLFRRLRDLTDRPEKASALAAGSAT